MTKSEIKNYLERVTGVKLGWRKNVGSMKNYTTLPVLKTFDGRPTIPLAVHKRILEDFPGCFVSPYQIDIPNKLITR